MRKLENDTWTVEREAGLDVAVHQFARRGPSPSSFCWYLQFRRILAGKLCRTQVEARATPDFYLVVVSSVGAQHTLRDRRDISVISCWLTLSLNCFAMSFKKDNGYEKAIISRFRSLHSGLCNQNKEFEELCDVEFIVGKEKTIFLAIGANIAMFSPVFR